MLRKSGVTGCYLSEEESNHQTRFKAFIVVRWSLAPVLIFKKERCEINQELKQQVIKQRQLGLSG